MTEYGLKNKEVKRKKEGKSDKRAERQGKTIRIRITPKIESCDICLGFLIIVSLLFTGC